MGLYYNLPVYKASYQLVKLIFACGNKFAREYRYTTGQELKKEGMSLIKNIYRANKSFDKTPAIGEARENVEVIRLYIRLMQEFNQLSLKKFVEINQGIEEVSKQLSNWESYSQKRSAPAPVSVTGVEEKMKTPPESPPTRAEASARSKSNNPLALKSEESRPKTGHIAWLHQKNRAINTEVIIPLGGNRNNSSAALNNQGSNGNYWSSTPNGTNSYNLNFNSSSVNPANNNNRANGFSVRCVKDLQKNYAKNGGDPELLLALFRAYFDTRRNKGSTANALAFAEGYEQKLFRLYEDIISRRYKIGQSICFIVDKPVKREIFAADFRDRVVHHLIFNYINPIFEKHFISDSYSCRLGKGTSEGIERVAHFMRSCSENYQKDCFILKLDIQGYFMAMDRDILYKKIESKLTTVRNPNFDVDLVLYLIRAVVYNDPTKNYRSKGKREGWIGLPKSKSLFFAKEGNGFPIGNLTSQLFGNIYLDEFDHFAREEIGVQFYGRYVDDMVFVHRDKEFLKSVILKVKNYLHNELGLEVHPKKIYLQHYVKGVGFLGTFIKPWRIYIGKKTKENFYVKIREWNEFVKNNGLPGEKDASRLIACVNSYLGIMKHYNTSILRKKILSGFCGEILKGILFYENFTKIGLARASISKNICK
jgi:hypothetical protein